ncbi:hypothetical protein BJG92_02897 [Arthrobacter sp. SO5]|nr:hypothetical protein [Arthrobacter sp. SO5]
MGRTGAGTTGAAGTETDGGRTGAGTTGAAGTDTDGPAGAAGTVSDEVWPAGTGAAGGIPGGGCAWPVLANAETRARKADKESPAAPIFAFRAGDGCRTRGLVIVAGGFLVGPIFRPLARVVRAGNVAAAGLFGQVRGGTGAAVIHRRWCWRAGWCGEVRSRRILRQEDFVGSTGEARGRVPQRPGVNRQRRGAGHEYGRHGKDQSCSCLHESTLEIARTRQMLGGSKICPRSVQRSAAGPAGRHDPPLGGHNQVCGY